MDDPGCRQRAAARSARAVLHKTHLSDVEKDLTPIRGSEAISLVFHLTRESYGLAGIAEPTYTRDQIPCRFVPWPPRD